MASAVVLSPAVRFPSSLARNIPAWSSLLLVGPMGWGRRRQQQQQQQHYATIVERLEKAEQKRAKEEAEMLQRQLLAKQMRRSDGLSPSLSSAKKTTDPNPPASKHANMATLEEEEERMGAEFEDGWEVRTESTKKEDGGREKNQTSFRYGTRKIYFAEPTETDLNPHLYPVKNVPENARSAQIAVVGVANAGKSTLINRLIGVKISAVSPRPQTTREQVLGVYTKDNVQVTFIDTPGIIPVYQQKKIIRSLVTASWTAVEESDVVLFIIDGSLKYDHDDLFILKHLKTKKVPIVLIVNKVDVVKDMETLSEKIQRFQDVYPDFESILLVSALTGQNIERLEELFATVSSPTTKWSYAAEQRTVFSRMQQVAEIIREQLFNTLEQELPYIIKQRNQGWTPLPNGTLRIDQALIVSRASQKKILVGTNGDNITKIRNTAEKNISQSFGQPVFLNLVVKIRKESKLYDEYD